MSDPGIKGLTVYLASPYSHPDPVMMEWRCEVAVKAAGWLMERGYVVFSPIAQSHPIGLALGRETDHGFWMNQDLPWLERADLLMVLQLPGWEQSRGVSEEIARAKEIGLRIEYLSPNVLEGLALRPPDIKDTNPKDAIGSNKLPIGLVPATAIAYASIAHLNGMLKYGAWNWRRAGVRSSIYIDAARRHLDRWQHGEELDEDGVPHLASLLACINILIDARECGKLNDDRPPSVALGRTIADLTLTVGELRDRHAGKNPKHYTIADNE